MNLNINNLKNICRNIYKFGMYNRKLRVICKFGKPLALQCSRKNYSLADKSANSVNGLGSKAYCTD